MNTVQYLQRGILTSLTDTAETSLQRISTAAQNQQERQIEHNQL